MKKFLLAVAIASGCYSVVILFQGNHSDGAFFYFVLNMIAILYLALRIKEDNGGLF